MPIACPIMPRVPKPSLNSLCSFAPTSATAAWMAKSRATYSDSSENASLHLLKRFNTPSSSSCRYNCCGKHAADTEIHSTADELGPPLLRAQVREPHSALVVESV